MFDDSSGACHSLLSLTFLWYVVTSSTQSFEPAALPGIRTLDFSHSWHMAHADHPVFHSTQHLMCIQARLMISSWWEFALYLADLLAGHAGPQGEIPGE